MRVDVFLVFRCECRGSALLARNHAVCGDVRPNCIGVDIYDSGIRSAMQRGHRMGDHVDDSSRLVRHVFRIRNIGGVRIGKERHSVGAGQFLPNATVEWRNLANRRDATSVAIHIAVPTLDDGHDGAQIDADERLVDHRTGSLQRVLVDDRLDRAVLNDKFISIEVQERLINFINFLFLLFVSITIVN